LPPRGRRSLALPPKGPSPPRPSLQGRDSPGNHMKGRTVSFKERGGDGRIEVIASGGHTMSIDGVMLCHTASWEARYNNWLLITLTPKSVLISFSFFAHSTHGDIRGHASLLAGAAKDIDSKPELRTARKSTSRKPLQFAPLQVGHIPAQPSRTPSNGADTEPLSPGRSKSLGSVVDRSLLKDGADAELAVNKDRPNSAQFHRTVLHQAWYCIACGIASHRTCRSVACFLLVM